ncbi:MAG: lipoyl(octanoyl) transferase LipB [Desulfamplus sp.]|nr:lipoyl(octanoyl) transferase LipB [Desulfamplus sp.]
MTHEFICKPPQIIDLGLIDYTKAFEMQKELVAKMINGDIEHDVILILEHQPVFTLGKRGGRENLVVSEEFLRSKNIEIIQTERGGNITYHGPGQLIFYPIVNIEKRKLGVSDFVCALEETMIRTSKDFSVNGVRDAKNHGIWAKNSQTGVNAKLGSIGLSVKRGISFHGLALNVNLDLTPFSWINPCGMAGILMTSLENETKHNIAIKSVKEKLLHHFKEITGIEI